MNKTKLLVIGFSCMLFISGCGQNKQTSTDTKSSSEAKTETAVNDSTSAETTAKETTLEQTTTEDEKPYAYTYNSQIILPQFKEALSDEECKATLLLMDAIENGKKSSPLNGLSEDSALKVWYAARLSCPLSALVDENSIETENDKISFVYSYKDSEVKKRINDWHTLVNKIITERLTASSSEENIAYELFDYVSRNVQYNYDVLGDPDAIDNLSAYGALTDGTGVCYNYSFAYAFLVSQCGLLCYDVEADGVEPGSEGHAWNMVRIHDKFYQLDCTWASGDYDNRYNYFGMSDDTRRKQLKDNDLKEDFYIRDSQDRTSRIKAPKCDKDLQ